MPLNVYVVTQALQPPSPLPLAAGKQTVITLCSVKKNPFQYFYLASKELNKLLLFITKS